MKSLLILLFVCFFSYGLYADTTFVSGTIVNETWTPAGSPYAVEGNILVSSLTIEPGVIVLFLGEYVFEVAGVLTAIGTEQDSIRFTKPANADAWQGIFFNFSQMGSELAYCIIDSSGNRGILVDNSSPLIRNSTIRYNSSSDWGGGIRSNSPLTLIDCKIEGNTTSSRLGGGIYSEGPLTMIRCTILNNSILFYNSTSTVAGGGIYSEGGLTMSNCLIEGNLAVSSNANPFQGATAVGGGIYLLSDSLSLTNCIIRYNYPQAGANTAAEVARGGGIYMSDGTVSLTNCILSNDSLYSRLQWGGSAATGGGIHVQAGNIILTNCTIAYNEYDGIFRNGGSVEVENSIFWENDGGSDQIIGTTTVTYSDVQGGYSGIGNINLNPIFESLTSLKIVPGSPCIDAGDPNTIYNDLCFPPSLGTDNNDMGAHGGPGACGWVEPITETEDEIISSVNQYALTQNYPNPFNPSTKINYQLPQGGFVTLKVYDVLGNEIETLVNEEKPAGSYEVNFNARDLSSGIYFYKLQADTFVETKKMVLIK